MRIVLGCPIKDREWCLAEWFQAVETQDVDVQFVFVYTKSEDDTEQILRDHGSTIITDDRPGRSRDEVLGHCWGSGNVYSYMADLRNTLLQEVINMEADYFFSIDSDIILPPNGLQQLLDFAETHSGVIAPAVNMTTGSTNWNVMSWVEPSRPSLANRVTTLPYAGPADVVMAAMLLDKEGMKCRWQSHSQGEDIGFSLDAEAKQIPRWWLPSVRCEHLMRKY